MKRPLRFLIVFSIGLAALGGIFGLAEWAWSLMDDSFARDNAVWLRQIETETPLRAYTLPDVKNIRDCGGWKTQDGRRVICWKSRTRRYDGPGRRHPQATHGRRAARNPAPAAGSRLL